MPPSDSYAALPKSRYAVSTFIHRMPSVLCVEPTEEIKAQIKPLLLQILCSHEAENLSVSHKSCANCSQPACTFIYTPVPHLHKSGPLVAVVGTMVCRSGNRHTEVNYNDHLTAVRVNGGGDAMNVERGPKIRCCGCGEIKAICNVARVA